MSIARRSSRDVTSRFTSRLKRAAHARQELLEGLLIADDRLGGVALVGQSVAFGSSFLPASGSASRSSDLAGWETNVRTSPHSRPEQTQGRMLLALEKKGEGRRSLMKGRV